MSDSKPAAPPGSDPIYKRLFAFPEMVADLLRSLLPAADLDFDASSLQKLPAEYVSDDFRQRRGDTVWRLRTQGRDLHVLVLLEFQTTDDATMALRILEYTAMLYRELMREGRLGPDGLLSPVLPIVLYNGVAPWRSPTQVRDLIAATGPALAEFQPSQRHVVLDERRAAADDPKLGDLMRGLVLFEQSRSAADLGRAAEFVESALRALSRDSGELEAAFAGWLHVLALRMDGIPASVAEANPSKKTLKEVRMTLADRVAEWPKPYIRQGRQQGREEGIAHERQLLRRLAAERFGAATADLLAVAIAAEADPDRLAEVGLAIVRCATGDELLRAAGVSA